MIQLTAAGKRFGPKILFQDLDWLITPHDRVGLVGANGTGKTTLLKTLAGIESLDYGSMTTMKGITTGYLPQDGLTLSGRTVFDECMSVFEGLHAMEREMMELTERMSVVDHESEEYRQIGDRYHHLQTHFAAHDGYALEAQAGTVLTGLGFRKEDWPRRTEEFSGGWQMRLAMAKLLLQKPNILLLDEPTNHLDLEARNWLEGYLREYPHSYVLISHDRYFLDITVDKTAEIWNKRITFYSGNYEKFLKEKTMRREQLEAAYRNQRERIEQLEAFINRFRYQATKAKQVQSRIKELEKIERIEIPPDEKAIHFKFPQPKPSGRVVAEFHDVAKSYGEKQVFRDVSFVVERGDRIALVGVNGAGKSTLIKLLAGSERLSAGEFKLGHNVQPDYFAQDQYKELNPDARMLDDLWSLAPGHTQTDLRSLLGCFLFSEDEVFKKLGVLSGGERNRYALARMLLRPSNFLLLDEPTNHLDMRAKDVLLESLERFSGTVVFVSHDRYFIDKLATRVFEIGGGEVNIFPGNYEDYVWRKQNGGAASSPASSRASNHNRVEAGDSSAVGGTALPPASPASHAAASTVVADGNGTAAPKQKKKINPYKLREMQEKRQKLEAEIAKAEADIADAEQKLLVFQNADETIRLTQFLDARRQALIARLAEWEEVSQELETVQ